MTTHLQPRSSRPPNMAQRAARVALTTNTNIQNLQSNLVYQESQKKDYATRCERMSKTSPSKLSPIGQPGNCRSQKTDQSDTYYPFTNEEKLKSSELDRIVESVENATKRLSLISTNTNSSKRKSKNHVGPWRLGRTLGRGSSGRVRLAKHSETGQLAAVKIVPKAKFQKQNTGKEGLSPLGIEREIIIMKLISHQNIMALYDVWENKGELYLVLEYVEGGELFDYLVKRGRLPEEEAIRYFQQIINGVSYCHQFNICHRDLKPENLLLDKNQNIKIADFGMAALEMNQKLLETSCGSPHYASPEIVSGKAYHGSPSDVWSCGIILFALLTGHLPFDDENIKTLLIKVQAGRFVVPEYVSKDAEDLIRKMLVIDPEDRIKIFDVVNHPLLKKYETSSTLKSSRNDKSMISQYYNKIEQMFLSTDDIDSDILKSLSILFHGTTESQLVPKLVSRSPNPEKIFYYLLQDYKRTNQCLQRKDKFNTRKVSSSLKKSKSSTRTLVMLQNEKTKSIINTSSAEQHKGTPSPRITRRTIRDSQGKLQISASRSSHRNVSFNNKKISSIVQNTTPSLSKSSSKKSFAGRVADHVYTEKSDHLEEALSSNDVKRISLLPPLSSLDLGLNIDSGWLGLNFNGSENLKNSNGEFASIYRDIFQTLRTPPPTPTRYTHTGKKHSFKIKVGSPLRNQITPPIDSYAISGSQIYEYTKSSDSKEPTSPITRRSKISRTTSKVGLLTLDPKFKPRRISENNRKVLNQVGVKANENRKSLSEMTLFASNTSLNLNKLLEIQVIDTKGNQTSKSIVQNFISNPKLQVPSSPLPILPTGTDHPEDKTPSFGGEDADLPSFLYSLEGHANSSWTKGRLSESSSRYSSSSLSNQDVTTINDEATYHELPDQTSVAKMIHVSNGSNITVFKTSIKSPILEQSAFVKLSEEEIDRKDGSTPADHHASINSVVFRNDGSGCQTLDSIQHPEINKQETDVDREVVVQVASGLSYEGFLDRSQGTVIHRPFYGSIRSSDEQDISASFEASSYDGNSCIDNYVSTPSDSGPKQAGHTKKSNSFDDDFEDVEDVDDEEDLIYGIESFGDARVHRLVGLDVTKQGDQLESTHRDTQSKQIVIPALNLKKNRIEKSREQNISKRSIPSHSSDDSEGSTIKKSNWFTRFFSSLSSKETTVIDNFPRMTSGNKHQKNAQSEIYQSKIPLAIIKKAIKSALLLKQQEGIVQNYYELSPNKITARVPIHGFFSTSMLIFEIIYDFDGNKLEVRKVRGSRKWFERILREVKFILKYETRRFEDDKSS